MMMMRRWLSKKKKVISTIKNLMMMILCLSIVTSDGCLFPFIPFFAQPVTLFLDIHTCLYTIWYMYTKKSKCIILFHFVQLASPFFSAWALTRSSQLRRATGIRNISFFHTQERRRHVHIKASGAFALVIKLFINNNEQGALLFFCNLLSFFSLYG